MTEAVAVRCGDDGSVEEVEDLIARLFADPAIGQIRIQRDPRFQWLRKRLPGRARKRIDLRSAIADWRRQVDHPARFLEVLHHLIDYSTALRNEMLEDELLGIMVPLLGSQAASSSALLAYLGWDGQSPPSANNPHLESSRESLVRMLRHKIIWTPVLDHALELLASRSASLDHEIGLLLCQAELSRTSTFDAAGLLFAQDVFGKRTGLSLIERGGERWVVAPNAAPAIPALPFGSRSLPHAVVAAPARPNGLSVAYTDARSTASGLPSPAVQQRVRDAYGELAHGTGIVGLAELAAKLNGMRVNLVPADLRLMVKEMPPLTVLQARWVALIGDKQQSILTRRLRQMLAVRTSLAPSTALIQLGKVHPAYKQLPEDVLRAFADVHHDFAFGATGRLCSRLTLKPKQELDQHELFIFNQLKDGARTHEQIIAAVRARPRVSEALVKDALRTSVIVMRDVDDRYSLVKDPPAPAETRATVVAPDQPESVPSIPAPGRQLALGQASAVAANRRGQTGAGPAEPAPPAPPTPLPPAIPERPADGQQHPSQTRPDADRAAPSQAPRGTTREAAATIAELLRFVREGTLLLPEIQRGYVWKQTQVRDLLDSLYRGYPIGTMLMWITEESLVARVVGGLSRAAPSPGPSHYLLDGQQRLTSLAQLQAGEEFDIRFNPATDEFRVASAVTRTNGWVSVSDVLRKGAVAVLRESGWQGEADMMDRIERLERVLDRRVPIHQLIDFPFEDVTEIFIRVNSKGTPLRSVELAIAKMAFRLPGFVTDELRHFSAYLTDCGWNFEESFLLRCLTAVTSNQISFTGLGPPTEDELRDGWRRTRQAIDQFLSLIEQRLGLRSIDWLTSTTAFVIPIIYLSRVPSRERDEHGLLRWFLLANARSRYIQGSGTMLKQDLRLLNEHAAHPFPRLIERIRLASGRLEVSEEDLIDAGQRSPFFLLAFLAMRSQQAKDWWTGELLRATNLSPDHPLEVHHIFPKNALGRSQTTRTQNEIANLVFLARPAPREVSAATSVAYLWDIPADQLRQQFIPELTADWRPDRFGQFLEKRRRLLAAAMNGVLATDW